MASQINAWLRISAKQKNSSKTIDLSEYCQMINIQNGNVDFCVELKNPRNSLDRIKEFNAKLGNVGQIIAGGKFMQFNFSLSDIEKISIA